MTSLSFQNMNNMRSLFGLLGLLLFVAGCSKPVPLPTQFSLDLPFSVKIGQTALGPEALGFSIRFDKMKADSRCPMGVKCITAGKADMELSILKGDTRKAVLLSFTTTQGIGNVTEFEGYDIRVVGVTPFKQENKEISPEQYAIAISVTKTKPPAPQIKLDTPFTLGMGERLPLAENAEYSVGLDSIIEDSRCAEGLQCIWAGRVVAAFSIQEGKQRNPVKLLTGDLSKGGSGSVDFGPYTLVFQSVTPNKSDSEPIPDEAYKATMLVRKKE